MATYYVRTDGDNGNAGTTDSSGGAWADLGYAASQMGEDDLCYIKSGTYTLTTSTPGAGGPAVLPASLASSIVGYETTPGDNCPTNDRPVINAGSVTGVQIITMSGTDSQRHSTLNVKVDGNNGSGNIGVRGPNNNNGRCVNSIAVNCPHSGMYNCGNFGNFASNCGIGFNGGSSFMCWADNCVKGFTGSITFGNFLISSNSTGAGYGDNQQGYRTFYMNSIAYNNGGDGFQARNGLSGQSYVNCISVGNGGYGFESRAPQGAFLSNCASYNNTLGRSDGFELVDTGAVVLTADPFIDAANGDFRLNKVSGGGLLLEKQGIQIPESGWPISIGPVQPVPIFDPTGLGGPTR